MTNIVYRDFNPALQDVAEGRIAAVNRSAAIDGLNQGGKVKILAVTNRQRSPGASDIPTAAEAGFPDVPAEGFQGFFGWRDMSVDLRDRIAADVRVVARRCPPSS